MKITFDTDSGNFHLSGRANPGEVQAFENAIATAMQAIGNGHIRNPAPNGTGKGMRSKQPVAQSSVIKC